MGKPAKPGVTHVRTTITLPSTLKERMDREAPEVNWSRLAAEAFEAKLDEMVVEKRTELTLEDVAARLRGSKRNRVDAVYNRGKKLGIDWAKRKAQIDDLQLFEDLRPGITPSEWKSLAGEKRGVPIAYRFIRWLAPERFGEREFQDKFWSIAGADEVQITKQPFVEGFIEGVLDVWNQVRPLVLDE